MTLTEYCIICLETFACENTLDENDRQKVCSTNNQYLL